MIHVIPGVIIAALLAIVIGLNVSAKRARREMTEQARRDQDERTRKEMQDFQP